MNSPSVHRGVTLVELMIAMLILAIVCVAWLEIIGIQSARREARRREAVERLAGMMDAFMYCCATGYSADEDYIDTPCYCQVNRNGNKISVDYEATEKYAYPVFSTEISPIGYQLQLARIDDFSDTEFPNRREFVSWDEPESCYWLVGRLYDVYGDLKDDDRQFFTLPVCLGPGSIIE